MQYAEILTDLKQTINESAQEIVHSMTGEEPGHNRSVKLGSLETLNWILKVLQNLEEFYE